MKPRLAALALAACGAHAAGPMVTDDAGLLEAKACQLESWVKHGREESELWALPACNPTGNFELTFGGARTRAGGESRFTDHVLQAKTTLRPLTDTHWGVALTLGTARRPARETASGWPGDPYLNVPLSVPLRDDGSWLLHVNAGAVHQGDTGRTLATWALANEVRLAESLSFFPEIYRSDWGRPYYQLGLRYALVKDRVHLALTVGDRVNGEPAQRWFSVGLRFVSPPVLP